MTSSALPDLHDTHDAEVDQNERPSVAHESIAEYISQQEQESDEDQEHSAARQSPAARPEACCPIGRRESKWIRRGSSALLGVSYSNRIDDLVDVPERDRKSKNRFQTSAEVAQGKD